MNALDTKTIRKALENFNAATAELVNDKTELASQEALTKAQEAVELLRQDDPAKTPEELIDERMEAERAVSISQLRLTRATAERLSKEAQIFGMLSSPAKDLADALRETAPLRQADLIEKLKAILSEDYQILSNQIERIAYHRAEQCYNAARLIERTQGTNEVAHAISNAIPLIESSN